MGTATKVIDHLRMVAKPRCWQEQGNKKYRTNSPYRPDSDSPSFLLIIEDEEHGGWKDFVDQTSGSLYELATHLGIELPAREDGRYVIDSTKRQYENLADYAQAHHAPVSAFEKLEWEYTTHKNRPCLKFPAWYPIWDDTGTTILETVKAYRLRFTDGQEPRYLWDRRGTKGWWYGLTSALKMVERTGKPLVLCNGEASTIVAQHYGIPAFCQTGGESAKLSDEAISYLKERYSNPIIIAMDKDKTGEKANEYFAETLGGTPIDLGLSDGGDLADFCGLYGDTALSAIENIANTAIAKTAKPDDYYAIRDTVTMAREFLNDLFYGTENLFGRVIGLPFGAIKRLGGYAELITTGKSIAIANVTGGGKTTLGLAMSDQYNVEGINTIVISGEWTTNEVIARQISRADKSHNPISFVDILRHEKAKAENGGEWNPNIDGMLSEEQSTQMARALRNMAEVKGRTYAFDDRQKGLLKKPRTVTNLRLILQHAGKQILSLRALGISIDVVILDYLSLYDTNEQSDNTEELKAEIFKEFCMEYDVLGITFTQVTKTAQRKSAEGKWLTMEDMLSVRGDKFNLILTINNLHRTRADVYGVDCERPHEIWLDPDDKTENTPNFVLAVQKNSLAPANNHVLLHFDWRTQSVREGLHPDWVFNQLMTEKGLMDVLMKRVTPK